MNPIEFIDCGQQVSLQGGGHFARPRASGFRDTSSNDLLSLVAEIRRGRPWREMVHERYAAERPWLHQIIASPCRTAFLGDVLPHGDGPVLDVGSGWGQIARPVAAIRPVVALEPVAERMAFIRAAAEQERVAERMAFVESDYLELEFTTLFSVICAIGVLEWAGAFQGAVDPQERQRQFLQKTKRELNEGGCLVLGIENRLGLKYLLGCPDDHLGVPSVACLDAPLAKARWKAMKGLDLQSFTYSQAELTILLQDAGYSEITFFGAFPDYKLPQAIIPFGLNGDTLNAWLRTHPAPLEHNGYDGSQLPKQFQEDLASHYQSLAAEGVAHAFVPSFFVRAR